MAELRSVDPSTLLLNPNNPRRTATPQAMEDQLVASIRAVGIIQPPRVTETGAGLMIVAGNRRRNAAIAAGLPEIDVMVCDADEAADAMRAVSENLIRASMTSVDIWRATEALEAQGWNEQAIADALALPARTVRRLKLLAHLHPAMLDVMATGNMPNEDQLRAIAAASRDEQAQVWKKYKPKKGQDLYWHQIAHALSKRRIPFSSAKFGEELAKAYGVEWEDDLFAPAGEDGRYTTNVDGFFGAQQEWLQDNLPPRGIVLTTNEYGSPTLPKKAEHVYGKPGKADHVGYYVDPRSGEVQTLAYRMPEPTKAAKAGKGGNTAAPDAAETPVRVRPDVTQKGNAIIGDLRTDALHEALRSDSIDDQTLLSLLVLAFAGKNVTVQSGSDAASWDRATVAATLTEGGVLTADADLVRAAARTMLVATLSCRDNMTNSGLVARIAGDAVDASRHLPNMATEEFLSCLSKAGVEKAAAAVEVRVEARAKDTRARLVERFATGVYHYPGALFRVTEEDIAAAKALEPRHYVPGAGWAANSGQGNGSAGEEDEAEGSPRDENLREVDAQDDGNDLPHIPAANDASPMMIAAE